MFTYIHTISPSQIEQLEALIERRDKDSYAAQKSDGIEHLNKLEPFDKVKEYYEAELAKKEQIIAQQRDIIRALGRTRAGNIRGPA